MNFFKKNKKKNKKKKNYKNVWKKKGVTLWVHPTLTLWKIRLRAWVTVICVFVRGGVRLEPRRHCYRQNCCCRSNHHHTRRGYITPARYCCHQRIPKRERARLVWYVLGYWVGLYLVVELHLEKAIRRWGERRIKKQTGKKRKVFLYFFFYLKGEKKMATEWVVPLPTTANTSMAGEVCWFNFSLSMFLFSPSKSKDLIFFSSSVV